jgi:hypothetical protein
MFNFTESQRSAEERLRRGSHRHRRSDTGQSRLHPEVVEELRSLILGFDRPSLVAVRRHLANWGARRGLRPPSRASLYNTLPRVQGHVYPVARLPPHVQAALYNLPRDGDVPGHQLAFYCFNYGSLAAVSYAAGLPWLDLYQADHLRGWRPRSRGLLHAVLRTRGIQ